MSLLVTGSIGIDTVEAPSGQATDTLGGSSVYFAHAASFFHPVRLVGVVGGDCPPGFLAPLEENENIDLSGLEVREDSKTFRWHGRYHEDVNQRDTISVELNVLDEKGPSIPEEFQDSRYVFLANTHPCLQMEMLDQLAAPDLIVADTMDLWIKSERDGLKALLMQIDGLVLNDSEAVLLTGKHNIVEAGQIIAGVVRRFVVIKKGEHGALLFMGDKVYPLPGYPSAKVVDPTGAGDSFAGAMLGYIAEKDDLSADTIRRAIAYGTVTASILLEDFSVNRFLQIGREDIDARLAMYEHMTRF